MSELLEDIGRSLGLAIMQSIPYKQAWKQCPGEEMDSWVQKRFLERQPITAMELEQARKWKDETVVWLANKIIELGWKRGQERGKSRILEAIDGRELDMYIQALCDFYSRLLMAQSDSKIIEEYRAR